MIEYKRYRWFYTSSGKLVIGGKNAEQNDQLLKETMQNKKKYYVMHTSHPGSPFSLIIGDINEISPEDLEECAIFTGCFSRAWKDGEKETKIHIFTTTQLFKDEKMKAGTWGIVGKPEERKVKLELVLTNQSSVLRAVPEKSANKVFLKIRPGKKDKTLMVDKLKEKLKIEVTSEEILSALPSGGVEIIGKSS